MFIGKVEKSNITENGDINDYKKITENNHFFQKPSYWGGVVSGVIASLVANAIWCIFFGS